MHRPALRAALATAAILGAGGGAVADVPARPTAPEVLEPSYRRTRRKYPRRAQRWQRQYAMGRHTFDNSPQACAARLAAEAKRNAPKTLPKHRRRAQRAHR